MKKIMSESELHCCFVEGVCDVNILKPKDLFYILESLQYWILETKEKNVSLNLHDKVQLLTVWSSFLSR